MTIDLYQLLFAAILAGALAVVAGLLVATYLGLLRMNPDVRRARMFIMADRVKRFLGAFTFGFVVITLEVTADLLGLVLPPAAAAAVLFLFLGAMIYGSFELFFVVRPRRRPSPARDAALLRAAAGGSSREERTGGSPDGGADAPR